MSASRSKSSFLSFIVMALLAYFVVVPIIIGASIGSAGSASELLKRTVELVPFGSHLYQLVFDTVVGALDLQLASAIESAPVLTSEVVTLELAKGLFTIVSYEALTLVGDMALGLKDGSGTWNAAKRLLFASVSALLAAYLAPFLMNSALGALGDASGQASAMIPAALSAAAFGGGSLYHAALLGLTVARAAVFVVVRFLLVGAAKLVAVYAFLLAALIGVESQQYLLSIESVGVLFAVVVAIGVVELIIDSVFGA